MLAKVFTIYAAFEGDDKVLTIYAALKGDDKVLTIYADFVENVNVLTMQLSLPIVNVKVNRNSIAKNSKFQSRCISPYVSVYADFFV